MKALGIGYCAKGVTANFVQVRYQHSPRKIMFDELFTLEIVNAEIASRLESQRGMVKCPNHVARDSLVAITTGQGRFDVPVVNSLMMFVVVQKDDLTGEVKRQRFRFADFKSSALIIQKIEFTH